MNQLNSYNTGIPQPTHDFHERVHRTLAQLPERKARRNRLPLAAAITAAAALAAFLLLNPALTGAVAERALALLGMPPVDRTAGNAAGQPASTTARPFATADPYATTPTTDRFPMLNAAEGAVNKVNAVCTVNGTTATITNAASDGSMLYLEMTLRRSADNKPLAFNAQEGTVSSLYVNGYRLALLCDVSAVDNSKALKRLQFRIPLLMEFTGDLSVELRTKFFGDKFSHAFRVQAAVPQEKSVSTDSVFDGKYRVNSARLSESPVSLTLKLNVTEAEKGYLSQAQKNKNDYMLKNGIEKSYCALMGNCFMVNGYSGLYQDAEQAERVGKPLELLFATMEPQQDGTYTLLFCFEKPIKPLEGLTLASQYSPDYDYTHGVKQPFSVRFGK